MKCDKCKEDFPEKEIHEHHILPKGIRKNNISIKEGGKLQLCKGHHNEIHSLLAIFVKIFTLDWIGKKDD